MRKYGLACDNLLSADVVTADGRLFTASSTENPDLFWAIRGGGGNFGIVTSFEYRLHPVGQVLGGLLIYPIEQARQIFSLYAELTRSAPDELGSLAVLATLPDGTRAVIVLVCYAGELAEGERLLHPFRAFQPILADQVGAMPYQAVQSIVENFNPKGMRNYWKTTYLTDLTTEAVEVMIHHYATVPAPHSHIVIEHVGGAVSRVGDVETAVSHRQAPYNLLGVGMWGDFTEDESNIGWVRELWQLMQPYSTGGTYVNYEPDQRPESVHFAYDQEKYARLVALKNQYDPENLFRLNHNITPAIG
jgi:FAD/FMN-containing dehydrogenase